MALFLPAVSSAYDNYKKLNCNCFDFLANYPYALYSSGHANFKQQEYPISSPSRKWLLGDSGGFQIGKGAGKFKRDWIAFNTATADFVQSVANYLQNFDSHMILDIPVWALNEPNSNLQSIQQCLNATHKTIEIFSNSSKKEMLNVFSASSNQTETDIWYESLKVYNIPNAAKVQLNAFSLPGLNGLKIGVVLDLFKKMIRDGVLNLNTTRIHFLGNGTLVHGYVYHIIEAALRNVIAPNITISFDAASAYVSGAYGLLYTNYNIKHLTKWNYSYNNWKNIIPHSKATVAEVFANSNLVVTPVLYNYHCSDLVTQDNTHTPLLYYIIFNHNSNLIAESHNALRNTFERITPNEFARGSENNDLFDYNNHTTTDYISAVTDYLLKKSTHMLNLPNIDRLSTRFRDTVYTTGELICYAQ